MPLLLVVTDNTATLRVANGRLRVIRHGQDFERRTVYRYEVWIGGSLAESGSDLRTGVGIDDGPKAMLGTLLSFLEACAESYDYEMRTGTRGENYDLFSAPVAEWAYQNSDELAMMRLDIEEPEE